MDLAIKYCNLHISNINICDNIAGFCKMTTPSTVIVGICVNIADIINIGEIIAYIDIAKMHFAIFCPQIHAAQHAVIKYWHYL